VRYLAALGLIPFHQTIHSGTRRKAQFR